MTIQAIIPILPVQSLERALIFYRRLGFTAKPYADGQDYAFLAREDFEVHLRSAPDLVDGQNPAGVYFHLDAGTAAVLEASFRDADIPILSALSVRPWHMNEFMLSDPDGNLLRFGELVTTP